MKKKRVYSFLESLADAASEADGRPMLLLMVAPPGAGKSTLTGGAACIEHLKQLGVEVVSTDSCVEAAWKSSASPGDMSYAELYRKHYDRGSRAAERRVRELVEAGSGVLVDKCNLRGRERLLSAARENGMFSACFVLPVTVDECVRRDAGRGERSVGEGAIRGNCRRADWKGEAHADGDDADVVYVVLEAARDGESF